MAKSKETKSGKLCCFSKSSTSSLSVLLKSETMVFQEAILLYPLGHSARMSSLEYFLLLAGWRFEKITNLSAESISGADGYSKLP